MLHAAEGDHGSAATHEVATESHEQEVGEMDAVESHVEEGDHGMSEEEHLEHALTQAKNRPWAAIYIAMIFFYSYQFVPLFIIVFKEPLLRVGRQYCLELWKAFLPIYYQVLLSYYYF